MLNVDVEHTGKHTVHFMVAGARLAKPQKKGRHATASDDAVKSHHRGGHRVQEPGKQHPGDRRPWATTSANDNLAG